jgi:hypothetical protein
LDTGNTAQDAQSDFSRARRARMLAAIGRRLRREPDDVALILPFEEVVEALGRVGENDAGLHTIPLDAIVGSVDRMRDFDRRFRPTTSRTRGRWERIAAARRRGEALPPISVYRIGDLYFVRDGHHRVSVARAMGDTVIDAYVSDVRTRVPLSTDMRVPDLPLKGHERLFRERVPLSTEQRDRIALTDPWDFGVLAEAIEAWGFRAMQERHEYLDRREVGRLWFEEEYAPGGRDADRRRLRRAPRVARRRLPARGRGALSPAAHARVERRGARPHTRRCGRAAAAHARPAAAPAHPLSVSLPPPPW